MTTIQILSTVKAFRDQQGGAGLQSTGVLVLVALAFIIYESLGHRR